MDKESIAFEHPLYKITRPNVDQAVIRERLFQTFENGSKRSVIWVTGPGGSGKTTLASSWLDAQSRTCVWYQVDAADSDPATFFYHLHHAVKKAAPRIRRPLPVLTPEQLYLLPVFSRRFFDELGRRLKTPAAVVFDNYQEAPRESRLHEIISNGIAALPQGITVIILSRGEPPEQYARLRANRQLQAIGWDELRFTLAETCELAQGYQSELPEEGLLREIHAAAEGWVAGLVLFLEHLKLGYASLQLDVSCQKSGVFDYFATELFNNAEPPLQNFLLRTAILPKITPEVANCLVGIT